ncbi:MAG TPA: ATP-binding protein [Patescibacteria group bacterium]|nr:ATP-binding protein [Patescibacteria group bacterium]
MYFQAKSFLNHTLKDVMLLLEAECGSVFLFDAAKNELVLDSFYNSSPLAVQGIRRRVGEGIAGKVVERRTPVLVRNIESDERFNHNGFNHYHTNSFISIPLFVADQLIGLINIADKVTGEPFSEKDLSTAVTVCKYACKVVENISKTSLLHEEKEKLNTQKALLEKYASVGKLAAGVVHEINNPLDGVIRYVNLILEHMEHSVAKEYLLEVKKGLHRIANITKSLLEFSRQVNSDITHTKKYVHLNELLEESLDAVREKVREGIQVRKNYSEQLPRVRDIGLQHVFINLIKNGLDAMPGGGTLEVATRITNTTLQVDVRDTGSGIPEELRSRIFEPFFTTKEKGTGLGLPICKEIVTKFGGTIEVQNNKDQGTTFTIVIPDKYLEK